MGTVTGFKDLQKTLRDSQRALKALDGTIGTLEFDPTDPSSVKDAIGTMERMVAEKTLPYRGNAVVENIAGQMKERYRTGILERAKGLK